MSKLIPVNDYFLVEVRAKEDNPHGLVGVPDVEEGVREGRVEAISDKMVFFGFNTFMFDSSLANKKVLDEVYEFYKGYVGKKVYWPERSESGAVIESEGKTYAFIKCSAIMAVEEE